MSKSRRSWAAVWVLLLCVLASGAARTVASAEDKPKPDKPKTGKEKADPVADLRAERPETRRAAVRQLAEQRTRASWQLVIGALEDRDSQVADEAQWCLGSIDDPVLLDALYGRSGLRAKDPWVRVRVAEAFGRMASAGGKGIDGLALAKSIDARDAEVARALLWSLEQQLRAKRPLGDVKKLADEIEPVWKARGDAEVRGRALVVLERLDHFRARPFVVEALADRDPRLRCAGLEAVRAWTEAERIEIATRALMDAEASVRSAAIGLLEEMTTREAFLQLVHQMEIEKRERLRWRLLAHLRKCSGEDHGFDANAWRSWAEKVTGGVATGTGPRARPVGDTRVQLAGLNLISDRVVFLIDFSGSTWDTKVGDRTRKQVLDLKLREALEALPEGTRFNVVPYTGEPIPWEKALVPATKANVARAVAWFERCNARGRGNYFDAVLLAMGDPEVDAVVALTDGVPTGGRRWNMELMVELVVERDRFRQVALDSVLVDAPRRRVREWTELAERTGGRCVEAKLE